MSYIASIGLEVHIQLQTETKMFCGCATSFGAKPNTNVCPVCLGYPGAMPTMNRKAIEYTVVAGLMIGSRISEDSRFDRKSYFYPDMPKNYQISQYDRPLCIGGSVDYELEGEPKTVAITRIHLEEDVGKSIHFAKASGVDFNRAGTPLMEIVTEPEMTSPEEAFGFLQALRQIMVYAGVSECNLEQGNLRCDVNCSVRKPNQQELGTKIEIKNMNTFRGIFHALQYEIPRQKDALEAGEILRQETRRWDPDAGITLTMRTKEAEHDYRYFPEPDLMPVVLPVETVAAWKAALPELPAHRRARFVSDYGLPDYDAGVLTSEKAMADFFESTCRHTANNKAVSNWMMTEVFRHLSESESSIDKLKLTPESLAALIELVDSKIIGSTNAKEVIGVLFEKGGDPKAIVEEKGLIQVSDTGELEAFVATAIRENAKSIQDYKNGKQAAIQFLMGQVMRLSRGKADPAVVIKLLKDKLDA